MMRTILLSILAFLTATLLAPAAYAQGDVAGEWHGTLTIPTGQLRLALTIRHGEGGALTAELESPDQSPGTRIPVTPIAVAGERLAFAIPSIRATYEGQWRAASGRFIGTFTQGSAVLPLELARGAAEARPTVAGLDGRWEGSVTRNGVALRLVLRIATGAGGTIAALDSPDMLAMGMQVAELAREGRNVSFAVPVSNVRYRGTLAADGARMTGTWTRTGSPDAEVTFVRGAQAAAAPRARPQMPRPPFPYRAEEVRFANPRAPGVTLAGTLTLPPGPGPFPAAILITGSGPQDRDESVFTHKPFAVLADRLTRAGIAVLRYDDRGTAASTGAYAGATSADFATDANAAFAFLRARPEIDRRAIGFVGHSEGGLIAPLAGRDNPEVAFFVLLAGPGTPTPRLMEAQRRAIGHSQGVSDADLDRSVPVQSAFYAAAASDGDAEAVKAGLRAALTDDMLRAAGVPLAQRDAMAAGAADPWFRYFARYDPRPALAAIRVPVLALNGGLDLQVVAADNLAGIAAALAGHGDVTVRELPGLNHMFQTARTGAVGEYADIEETISPAALDIVTEWIGTRFDRRGGSAPQASAH
ncbi:MAG TPA: alpha/beta hydrolase [Allosphingosinicella sp.]|jgi:pimeloyl-ACP methyl ester carboxylesterase